MFPGSSSYLFMPPPNMPQPQLNAISGRWASEAFTSEFCTPNPISAQALHKMKLEQRMQQQQYGKKGGGGASTAAAAAANNSESWQMGSRQTTTDAASATPQADYPPPPPPVFPKSVPLPIQKSKMMKWYQQVEVWCLEPRKQDKERLVVAPPPRPPPFSDRDASVVPNVDLTAPVPPKALAAAGPQQQQQLPSSSSSFAFPYPKPLTVTVGGIPTAPPPALPTPPAAIPQSVAPSEQQPPRAPAQQVPKGAPYNYHGWVDRCRHWWRHTAHHYDKLRELFEKNRVGSTADTSMQPSGEGLGLTATSLAAAKQKAPPSGPRENDDDAATVGIVAAPPAATTATAHNDEEQTSSSVGERKSGGGVAFTGSGTPAFPSRALVDEFCA